jgi:site-specific DNA recombinase
MTTAIYVRVSTDRQALAQTIDQQIERLRAHLRAEDQELLCEHIFRDDGSSGATLNRPGLDRLRDQLREGAIDRVLILSPDRLARNYVHQMVLLEEFERYGCQVHFLDQPIRHDPQDHLLLHIRGAVAEYERTLIADRMRRGRQMKLRAGVLLPWPAPPYGYRVHPDRPRDPAGVQIEPTEGVVVQEVFRRYSHGHETLVGIDQVSVAAWHQVAQGQATLEQCHAAWPPFQSYLHRCSLCGPTTIAPGSHPTFGDPSHWQTCCESRPSPL